MSQQNDKITEQMNNINNGEFYLFSYGSNIPEQLAERLNEGKNNNLNNLTATIKNNSYCAILNKMKRGFFSHSEYWNGSTATLMEDNRSYVAGIALKIKKDNNNFTIGHFSINFHNLMKKEAVNVGKYELKAIQNLKLDGSNVFTQNGFAFIGNLNFRNSTNSAEAIESPSIAYLKAIAKMLKYRRILKNDNSNNDIEIDILERKGDKWVYTMKLSFKVDTLLL
jgi:hypothetical protein